jgi:hypothetical protein
MTGQLVNPLGLGTGLAPISWSLEIDEMTYRNYSATFMVKTTDPMDGPGIVSQTAGLPQMGAPYQLGNDADQWAFCYPNMKISISQEKKGETTRFWEVGMKFSTKPLNLCLTVPITDPLLQPQEASGSFVKYTKPGFYDRYGNPITSSSHELFQGPQNEWDGNRPTVKLSQNVSSLDLQIFGSYVDCLNQFPIWGVPARCVKLSSASWTRKAYGICSFYYTREFEFDINMETFDRMIPDHGTKVLNGQWGVSGTGCTLNIVVNSVGAITTATVAANGSGYVKGANITLAVVGGSNGLVQVLVGGDGKVSKVVQIVSGGSGYVAGSALATKGNDWIVNKINGQLPDPNNPTHFVRFKDRQGELSTVLLDGGGLPTGTIIGIGSDNPPPKNPPTTTPAKAGSGNNYIPAQQPGTRFVQYYNEVDFLALGLPTSF